MVGPKFFVMNDLVEETFEVEVESCIMKYRWELMKGEEDNKKSKDTADVAFNTLFEELYTEEEKIEHEEEMEMAEAELRMIFNPSDNKLDLRRRRVTDLKGNSRVCFPRRSKTLS